MQVFSRTRVVICVSLLTIGVAGWLSPQTFALGFRNPDQGSRGTGQGEAFTAQADDGSAIYYNPAGLTQLSGTALTSGGYLLFPSSRFSGPSGSDEMDAVSFLPHLYATTDFGAERWHFGLGVNLPYGNVAEYGKNGPFRYTAVDSMLAVYNFAPAAAVQLNDQLSLGMAINIYYGETELNRYTPLSVLFMNPFLPDGRFQFKGNGFAVGATLGALWKINDQHSFGLVYRTPFSIDFDGHAVVSNDPTAALGYSDASARIEFPQTVTLGYAFRPIENLKLEAGIEWTNWDTLNVVKLRSPNPGFDSSTNPTSAIPFHWEDSFFYEFGAEYLLNDNWVLRLGYIFSENTVPDRTFSATIPDSDRHVGSVGFGYVGERLIIDVAYQLSILETRTVSGSPDNNFDFVGDADGTWRGIGHAIMVTSTLELW